jgi:hypothetical protein
MKAGAQAYAAVALRRAGIAGSGDRRREKPLIVLTAAFASTKTTSTETGTMQPAVPFDAPI